MFDQRTQTICGIIAAVCAVIGLGIAFIVNEDVISSFIQDRVVPIIQFVIEYRQTLALAIVILLFSMILGLVLSRLK